MEGGKLVKIHANAKRWSLYAGRAGLLVSVLGVIAVGFTLGVAWDRFGAGTGPADAQAPAAASPTPVP
jgi:hypothetical protein